MEEREIGWISVENAVAKLGVDVKALEVLVKSGQIKYKAKSKDGRLQYYVENSKLLLRLQKKKKSPFQIAGSFFGQSVVATTSTITATLVLKAISSPHPATRSIDLAASTDEYFHHHIDRSEQEISGISNLLTVIAHYDAIGRNPDDLLQVVSRLADQTIFGTQKLFVAKPLASTSSRSVEAFVQNSIYGNYRLIVAPFLVKSNKVSIKITDVEALIPVFNISNSGSPKLSIMSRDLYAAIQQVSRHAKFDLQSLNELTPDIIDIARLLSELRVYDDIFWGGVET